MSMICLYFLQEFVRVTEERKADKKIREYIKANGKMIKGARIIEKLFFEYKMILNIPEITGYKNEFLGTVLRKQAMIMKLLSRLTA